MEKSSLSSKGQNLKDCSMNNYCLLKPIHLNVIREHHTGADPFRVVTGDFVTTEDGTGIVHTAPAFGADDFKVGKKYNLGILTMVDREGKFVDGTG